MNELTGIAPIFQNAPLAAIIGFILWRMGERVADIVGQYVKSQTEAAAANKQILEGLKTCIESISRDMCEVKKSVEDMAEKVERIEDEIERGNNK